MVKVVNCESALDDLFPTVLWRSLHVHSLFSLQLKVRPRDIQLCQETSSGVDASGHYQLGDLVQLEWVHSSDNLLHLCMFTLSLVPGLSRGGGKREPGTDRLHMRLIYQHSGNIVYFPYITHVTSSNPYAALNIILRDCDIRNCKLACTYAPMPWHHKWQNFELIKRMHKQSVPGSLFPPPPWEPGYEASSCCASVSVEHCTLQLLSVSIQWSCLHSNIIHKFELLR